MPHLLLASDLITASSAPPDDSVVAGPWGFLIFILLVGAIAFLGWSMVRQFRKVDAAKENGLYDESRAEAQAREQAEQQTGPQTGHQTEHPAEQTQQH